MKSVDIQQGRFLRPCLVGMVLLLTPVMAAAQARGVSISQARVGGRLATVLRADPGGGPGGRDAVVHFSVGAALFTPGEHGEINVATQEVLPLSGGQLMVGINPPVFVNNPVVEFMGAGNGLSYQMTPAGPGLYVVDFSSTSAPLNMQAGLFMKLQGIVSQQLPAGDPVQVTLSVTARSLAGRPLTVAALGSNTTLMTPLPALSVRVKGNRNLVAGQTVLVEIRTMTNPKPISEGQVCLFFEPAFFSSLGAATVLSAVPDVSFNMDVQASGQVRIQFSSPSASINSQPGALLTVELTVADNVAPGAQSSIDVDLMQTNLVDYTGLPLAIDAKSGVFQVKP